MKKLISILIMLFFSIPTFSQFSGGYGDGYSAKKLSSASIISSALLVSPKELYLRDNSGAFFNNTDLIAQQLANPALIRTGVAADGVSKLLVAVETNYPVKFWIPSSSDDNGTLGSLANPDAGFKSNGITIQPNVTYNGKNYAVAVYTTPDVIGGNGKERTFQIKYAVVADINNVASQDVKIVPSPVVFVHGMWSGPSAWTNYAGQIQSQTGRHCEFADYHNDNACTFNPSPMIHSTGIDAVGVAITKANDFMLEQGIECSQVDVIGHSAGGLMTKSFIQRTQNLKYIGLNIPNIKMKGFIHRFITIGTPHLGTPLGPFLYNHKNDIISILGSPIGQKTFEDKLKDMKMPVGPMHIDFDINSTTMQAISTIYVKNHLIGAHWYLLGAPFHSVVNELTGLVNGSTLESVIGIGGNDVIVPLNSQLSGYSTTENHISYFTGITHSTLPYLPNGATETSSDLICAELISLLQTTDATKFSDHIPAPTSSSPIIRKKSGETTMLSHVNKPITIQSTTESITITSPSSGATFTLSTTTQITITISTNAETRLSTSGLCIVAGIGMYEIPQTPPYSITFNIPADAPLGRINITVLCRSTTNTLLGADSYFTLNTTMQAIQLTAFPNKMTLSPTKPSRPLYVQGFFGASVSTASIIDVTDGSTGTTFATMSGGTIASVSAVGFVTMAGIGVDKVIISLGGVSTTVSVSIVPDLLSPTIGTLLQSTSVTLQWLSVTGANSYSLQLSTNSTFSSAVVTFANLTLTSQNVTIATSSLYFWRVKAFSTTSSTEWSESWTFQTYIQPPTNLTATATNAQVSLAWTTSASANITGYALYRGLTSGNYSLLVTTTTTTYTDVAVTNCTTYYYSVKALTFTDQSLFSLEADATPSVFRTLTVIAPNSAGLLLANNVTTITWTWTGCMDSVRISYSLDGGSTWNSINSITNTGAYNWTVPNANSTQALVKVESISYPQVYDMSNAYFEIFAPFVLVSPSGGETLYTASTATIAWTTTGATISYVNLDYSTNNGNVWTTIATAVANIGNYSWTVPNVISTQCLVRVSSSGNIRFNDLSHLPFSIARNITIVYPSGNELLNAGSTATITWTTTGATISQVDLAYSSNNGSSWTTIATATTNTGSFSWSVPNIQTTQALVRVSSSGNIAVSDVSNAPFTIAIIGVVNLTNYLFTTTTTTYSEFSDGTLCSFSNFDDATSTASISFAFGYAGTTQSTVTICTNGWLGIGTLSDVSLSNNLSATTYLNRVAPLWYDLHLGTTGTVRYKTTGTAPNRVFITQWSNVRSYNGTSESLKFQAKLYEGSNIIEFAYGSATPDELSASIGAIGATGGVNDFISVTPGTPATASSSVSNDAIAPANYPMNGTLYRFAPVGGGICDNKSIALDGINSYISIPHSAFLGSITTTNALTVEAWIKINGWYGGVWFPVVNKNLASGWLFQISNTALNLIINTAGTQANYSVPLNQWTHVAVTYNQSTATVNYYINGTLVSTGNFNQSIASSTTPLSIGYDPFGAIEYSNGNIDEVRIWNYARSAAQIAANYASQITGSESGLVGYWRFNNTLAGNYIADASGNGNVGTILNNGTFSSSVPPLNTCNFNTEPPILLSPLNNSTFTSTSATLQWNPVANATQYYVVVSTPVSFFTNATVTGTSISISGLSLSLSYSWQVYSLKGSTWSASSSVWSIQPLQPPSQISPANGSTGNPIIALFSYSTVTNATSYEVQLSSSNTFNSLISVISGTGNPFSDPNNTLANNGLYYWRVRSIASSGAIGYWSPIWSFQVVTSGTVPVAPTLIAPPNNAIVPTPVSFQTSTVANISFYHIQFSTNATFDNIGWWLWSAPTLPATNLAAGVQYFWRARTINSSNTSAWSSVWSFTVSNCTPTYSYLCSSNDFINSVTFNTISNINSGCNGQTNNYILYSTMSTTVVAGQSYNISLQSGPSWAQGFGVWIDFNQNSIFEDSERVLLTTQATIAVVTGQIPIPTSATSGATSMRVRCAYLSNPTGPCDNYSYGETEDYTIIIQSNSPNFVFWGSSTPGSPTTSTIKRANSNGSNPVTIYNAPDNASLKGLDFNPINNRIYASVAGISTASIISMSQNGTDFQVLASDLISNLHPIDCKISGNYLYWADWNGYIKRSNLDGTNLQTLVNGQTNPWGIDVDAAGGKIYWSNQTSNTLMRSNLDGSSVEGIIAGLYHPRGIKLNLSEQKIYFVDSGNKMIKKVNLNGTNIVTLATLTSNNNPLDIELSGSKMYWTDNLTDSVYVANLDGTQIQQIAFDPINGFFGPFGITFSFTVPPPVITSYSPARNTTSSVLSQNISLGWNTAMAPITAGNMLVRGSMTGPKYSTSGTITTSGANVTMTHPNFKPGELVSVTVTGATSASGIKTTSATTYSYFAKAGVATGNFTLSSTASVGAQPTYLAVGDFNGDGILDLATANYNDNTVSICLGNSSGDFSTTINYGVGSNPYSVAVGDFNGDGKLDFATANYMDNTVSICLGTGTGGFGTATNFAVGYNPLSVALGDFNGDGILDFATANSNSANVSICLGTGTGSFSTATNYAVGTNPYSVAQGDFNGDGILDFATANFGSANVSICLGIGTGSFSTAANYSVGSDPRFVALGDFNGDGQLDFATANYTTSNVSICLGTGSGGFGNATNFSVGTNPRSVTLGDFNGDGILDFATANWTDNNVSICLGTGIGGFGNPTNYAVESYPRPLAVGDFNGDGILDFAVPNQGSNNVSVLLGQAPSLPVSATKSTITANSLSLKVGQTTTLTVTFRDANGNLTTIGGSISLNLIGFGSLNVNNIAPNGQTTATLTYTAGTNLQGSMSSNAYISIVGNAGQTNASVLLAVYPADASATTSTLSPLTITTTVNMTVPITVTFKDQFGNYTTTGNLIITKINGFGAISTSGVILANPNSTVQINYIAGSNLAGLPYSTAQIQIANATVSNVSSTSTITVLPGGVATVLNVRAPLQGYWNGTTHKPAALMLELRTGTDLSLSTLVARGSGITSTNGTVNVGLSGITTGQYWLVIRSNGHIPVASSTLITVTSGTTTSYDFSTSNSKDEGYQTILIGGAWCMKAGDVNGDASIDTDYNSYIRLNGGSGNPDIPMLEGSSLAIGTSMLLNVRAPLQGFWNGSTHKPAALTVEIRSGSDLSLSTLVARGTGITSTNGTVSVGFSGVSSGQYWIVVRSSGHIPVASYQRIQINDNQATPYDFSTSNGQDEGYQTILIGGAWCMKAGDVNGDASIDTDYNSFIRLNGGSGNPDIPEP